MSPKRIRAKKARLGLAIVLAAVTTSGLARADDVPAPSTSEPAVTPPPEQRPTAASADERMTAARKQFQAGVNLLDDPDGAKYDEAYDAFKAAYELSQSPKVLGNVGFCAMHLERDGEAIDAYTTYLRESPDISERERAQIQKDLATITSTVATVRVVVRRPGARFVLVDTRVQTRGPTVQNTYLVEGGQATVRIRPGRHAFKVKDGAKESLVFETSVAAAGAVYHDFVFPAPKVDAPAALLAVPPSPSVAGPVVMGITGLLALGAGIGSGVLARSTTSDIEGRCPNNVCPADYDLDSRRDTAKTFGTVADVALIGGGSLLAGALLWYAVLPRNRGANAAAVPASPTALRSSAMCTHSGCALQLQGGF